MHYKKLFIGIGIAIITLLIVWWLFTSIFSVRFYGRQAETVPSAGRSAPGVFELSNPLVSSDEAISVAKTPSSDSPLTQKKIIKSGSLMLVVDDTVKTVSTITQLVEQKEGFVQNSHVTDRGDVGKQASLTVRVPVTRFSETMEALKTLANLVEDEQVGGQDVTEQFIDLEARLRNLKAGEQQFLETLKRAFTIEDILKVQDRLSQVRSQIESLQGQLKYLTNQTDLATISITLSEEPTVTLSLRDFRPVTILKTSLRALLQGLIVLFNLLVQFVIVWIPLIFIGAVLLGIVIWIVKVIVISLKNKFGA